MAYMDASGNPLGKVINQHAFPSAATATGTANGTTACSWTRNNCGANDEPFAFHTGGCNVVMMDGSVRFLSDSLDPITLRRLVTPRRRRPAETTSKAARVRRAGAGPSAPALFWQPFMTGRLDFVEKGPQRPVVILSERRICGDVIDPSLRSG